MLRTNPRRSASKLALRSFANCCSSFTKFCHPDFRCLEPEAKQKASQGDAAGKDIAVEGARVEEALRAAGEGVETVEAASTKEDIKVVEEPPEEAAS